MMVNKKILFFIPVPLFASILAAVVISGGDYSLSLSGFTALFSAVKPSGGDFVMQSSAGQSLGTAELTGGDYSVTGGEIPVDVAAEVSYLQSDLDNAIAFPNPFRPGSGGAYDASEITFRNLTQLVTIRIYTIAGELVRTIENDNPLGQATWDAKNDSGESVASGVYIYIITSDNKAKKTGKIGIIR